VARAGLHAGGYRSRVSAQPRSAKRAIDSVASKFVLIVLGLGCLAFWAVIPTGGVWLGGRLGNDFAQQLIATLGLVLAGMVAMAVILGWLNDLYLRTTGGALVVMSDGTSFRRRGPLETVLVWSLVPLAVALVVWLALGKPT